MSVTYLEAIREAQAYPEHDSRVYIYGQDVLGVPSRPPKIWHKDSLKGSSMHPLAKTR